jgi:hypothetical protein
MANLLVKLIEYRLNSVNSWLDEHNNPSDREWAIGIACEEMGKIAEELRLVKYATDMGEKVLLGKRCFADYHRTKKRLDEVLEN